MKPADRVEQVPPSGIRRFFELAAEMDNVISLGVGEPDFSAPWAARDAAIGALERGQTSYTVNRGRADLREAIAASMADRYDLSYDPETEVLVTAGASEGIDLAVRAFIDPGDTVAVVQPSYVSYVPSVLFAGGEVLPVPTLPEDGFALTADRLRECSAGEADALLFCYPNNPTGATLTASALEEVAAFARENDLTVFSDEIYAALTYDHDHTSIATLPGMRERTLVFNGFSKAYAMTGMRLGYVLGPADAVTALNRIHQYTMLSAPTTAQHAGLAALEGGDEAVTEMRSAYNRRRNFVCSRLTELGLSYARPHGAFYVFPECPTDDAGAFAESLLKETGVAVVPGTAFGDGGEGHVRLSYATGLPQLREAFDRMEAYLA